MRGNLRSLCVATELLLTCFLHSFVLFAHNTHRIDWNGGDLFVTTRATPVGMSGEIRKVEDGSIVGSLRER